MTELHGSLLIGVVAAVTILIRSAPFLLFPADKSTPGWVLCLGQMLPSAVVGILVVYCLYGATPSSFPYEIPEGTALLMVVLLHLWKRNTLLGIADGTVFCMLLVQLVSWKPLETVTFLWEGTYESGFRNVCRHGRFCV